MSNPFLRINQRTFIYNDLDKKGKLYQNKKKAIQDLEKRYTRDLNGVSRVCGWDEQFWKDRRFYMQEVHFEPEHLKYALENKKAFIKWLLTKYPKYNIPYDPKKRNIWVHLKYGREKDAKFVHINPYYAARQRDLLFGTNGIEAITADNWRERIRDAKDEQEIEDIKLLLDSKWEVDNFVDVIESLIYATNDDLWQLNWHTNGVEKEPEGTWYLDDIGKTGNKKHQDKKYFSTLNYDEYLPGVLRHLYTEKFKEQFARGGSKSAWGSSATGSINALVQLQQEAGMDFCHFVAYDLMFDELHRVIDNAMYKTQECGYFHRYEDWFNRVPSSLKNKKGRVMPDLVTWSSDSPPKQTPDKTSSVNPELGEEKELSDKPKVSKQDQEKQVKDKLAGIKDKLKDQNLNKKEIRNELSDLGVELAELERKSDGSDDYKQEIGNLTKQIKELRQQLEEVKQSLKGMLEEAKDYALKLFNFFKKENIKQITFEKDGSAKVEYEDNKNSKNISASEIDNNQELLILKEYSKQSQQKSLSRQELSQIVGSTSSPTSTEKGHWDKYGKYYVGAGVATVLIAIGVAVCHLWIKKRKP